MDASSIVASGQRAAARTDTSAGSTSALDPQWSRIAVFDTSGKYLREFAAFDGKAGRRPRCHEGKRREHEHRCSNHDRSQLSPQHTSIKSQTRRACAI